MSFFKLTKPLNLFIYFAIFLAICVFLFKDTEAFNNLSCYISSTTTKTGLQNKITKSPCATFIEEAENGKYEGKYNECYSDCLIDPAGDARIYCGNGSECDAFCFNQS